MAHLEVSLNVDERIIAIKDNASQLNAQQNLNQIQLEITAAQAEIHILQQEIQNAQVLIGDAQNAINQS